MSREGYNFSHETKQLAREEAFYRCEICGEEEKRGNRLEVHHMVAVFYARECNIPHALITSIANAAVLCHTCHIDTVHKQDNRFQYWMLALHIFDYETKPDFRKDAWRSDPNHPSNQIVLDVRKPRAKKKNLRTSKGLLFSGVPEKKKQFQSG